MASFDSSVKYVQKVLLISISREMKNFMKKKVPTNFLESNLDFYLTIGLRNAFSYAYRSKHNL